jgi:hypothetical protein
MFLSKPVPGVNRLVFGRLANERRGHQRSVDGREQLTAEDAGHVEVKEVLCSASTANMELKVLEMPSGIPSLHEP